MSDAESVFLELLRARTVAENVAWLQGYKGKPPCVLIPNDCHRCVAQACEDYAHGIWNRAITFDAKGVRVDTSSNGAGEFTQAFTWAEVLAIMPWR